MKRIILFDCDGTLFPSPSFSDVWLPTVAKKFFGVPSKKLGKKAFNEVFLKREIKEGYLSFGERIRLMAKNNSVNLSEEELEKLSQKVTLRHKQYLSDLSPTSGLVPLLKFLKRTSHALYIISVGAIKWKKEITDRLGITHFFEDIFTEENIGHLKPSKEFYMTVSKRLNTPPKNLIVIGDDEIDLAAKKFGFEVIWMDFHDKKNSGYSYDLRARTFWEVLDYFEEKEHVGGIYSF